jgi:hypothetical protein
MRTSLKIAGTLTLALLAEPSLAYTECDVNLQKIFSGDDGYIWFHFTNGGSAMIVPTDPDKQAMTALATSALMGGHPMTIRYSADSVVCNSLGRSDVIGLYLK